jgi:hypothetical protein
MSPREKARRARASLLARPLAKTRSLALRRLSYRAKTLQPAFRNRELIRSQRRWAPGQPATLRRGRKQRDAKLVLDRFELSSRENGIIVNWLGDKRFPVLVADFQHADSTLKCYTPEALFPEEFDRFLPLLFQALSSARPVGYRQPRFVNLLADHEILAKPLRDFVLAHLQSDPDKYQLNILF